MITTNELYNDLERKIRCGDLTGKLPSVAQLTRHYGTSHNTVQRAVERLKLQGIVYGHHGKGVFVCERPELPAGGKIAVLQKLDNMNNPFYMHLFQHLKERLCKQDVEIDMICGFSDSLGQYNAAIVVDNFLEKQDIAVLKHTLSPEKIIALNWDEPGLPSIANDNRQGGYRSLEYLYERGHRSICLIGSADQLINTDIFQKRWQGVEDFLKEHPDMTLEKLLLKENQKDHFNEIVELLTDYQKQKGLPEVIFTFAGYYALGIITWLQQTHRRVPEDVSLLCYDNVEFATFTNPPLTTVKEEYELLAEQLEQYILALIRGTPLPEIKPVAPVIMERSSVRDLREIMK